MGLNIDKKIGDTSYIALSGRLDTMTAPELDALIDELIPVSSKLEFDCEGLEYISSAGLRIVLKAQKAMEHKGGMKLKNVPHSVMDVFDITGFSDFLTIEN
jgi:anti-sigma B factor antagonist